MVVYFGSLDYPFIAPMHKKHSEIDKQVTIRRFIT